MKEESKYDVNYWRERCFLAEKVIEYSGPYKGEERDYYRALTEYNTKTRESSDFPLGTQPQ